LTSTIAVTPLAAQLATSLGVMRRDEFAMSGCCAPMPPQNALMPAPLPVGSIFGVLKLLLRRPNCSATTVANG